MNYIFLAIACLFLFLINTIFDKLASNNLSGILVSTVKAFICAIILIIYACITGTIKDIFVFNSTKEILMVIFFGITQSCNWFLYFFAMKRSNLNAFSCFNETSFLFFANFWTLIFSFNGSINSTNPFSVVVYIIGLLFTISGALLIFLNKKINEGTKKIWMAIDLAACCVGSIYSITGTIVLPNIPVEILTFYTMIAIFIVGLVISIINRDYKDIKKITKTNALAIGLGAVVNVSVFILRLTANSMDNANIAVVNVIIASYFLILTLGQAIFKKKKFQNVVWAVFILMVIGMVLSSVAKYI